MGNRALKTGDLVTSRMTAGHALFATPDDNTGVRNGWFTFGMYLGCVWVESKNNLRDRLLYACVLDSETMAIGWVRKKWLRKV